MAAWVTFNEAIKASTSLVSCCNLIFGMLRGYLSCLSLLSLSQSTSFVSSLFFKSYELQIESFPSASRRVNGRSRACACLVSKFFPLRFDLMRWQVLQLAAGFDLAPFRKNELKSSILPQDHGVLAISKPLRNSCKICAQKRKPWIFAKES